MDVCLRYNERDNSFVKWFTFEIGKDGKILRQNTSETIEYNMESLAKFSFSIFLSSFAICGGASSAYYNGLLDGCRKF